MIARNTKPLQIVLAAAMMLGMTGAAIAADDSGSSGQSSGGSQSAGVEVSDEQLQKFADAYGQIQSVRAEYTPKIRNADDQQKRAQLKKQGQQEMVAAIKQADLEIQEYQQIGQQLNGNKGLQARLQELMQEEQESQDPQ